MWFVTLLKTSALNRMERETKTTSGHCMQCKIALFPGLSFHHPFFDRFKFLHSVKNWRPGNDTIENPVCSNLLLLIRPINLLRQIVTCILRMHRHRTCPSCHLAITCIACHTEASFKPPPELVYERQLVSKLVLHMGAITAA